MRSGRLSYRFGLSTDLERTVNRLAQLAVNRDGFAFDPATGESYSINPTGVLILERLIAGKEPDDIAAELVEQFEVEPSEAQRDVLDFIEHLRTHRLIS